VATEPSGIGVSPEAGGGPLVCPPDESPVDKLYTELVAKVREVRPRDDLAPLERAFRFASEKHKLQTRDSGDPYMVHPLMVAHLLADMRMDQVSLETGLLHDVVEDTSVTVEDVRKNFGEDVARCVDGVTKLSKLDFFSAEERQAESFR
jgi:GTP diphosphokinase / guanosine-3',5'-bis(diphosphate) 3'-diphosphatase